MIKDAITDSRIVSYFQPIIDNKTKKIVKYESLVRLIDAENKVLSPYFFLDTAKKSNHYLKITNIVLEHSFGVLKHSNFDISINISALDIEHRAMRDKILELLEENKQRANRVVFELLEDEAIKDFDLVKKFISQIKSYGVKIAIDDFGAGYSNFERLLDYQPDILKIDGCLIRDIETSSYSLSAVKSIVTFAKEQNLQTIAEFIENESIFNIVRDLGVDFSQGYYFGKPEPLN
jgi:EAL domain-containing protein (putative c-di-GMP-specific phosphodiesterase class I)